MRIHNYFENLIKISILTQVKQKNPCQHNSSTRKVSHFFSGKIVAVGQGRTSDEGKTIPMSVKEGDTVIYAKYGGTEIKIEGNEFLIIKENDILAIKK